jgi:hypothetical protein
MLNNFQQNGTQHKVTQHIDDTHQINKQNNDKQHTNTQSYEGKAGAFQIQMLPRPHATGHRPQATGLPGSLA